MMIKICKIPSCLFIMMPNNNNHQKNRDLRKLTSFHLGLKISKTRFLCNNWILPFINSVYEICNPLEQSYSTKQKENKFRDDFEDCIEPIFNSENSSKTTNQFFLHCANCDVERQIVLSKITSIDDDDDDAVLAENKSCTVYIVISKTKVKILLTKCNFDNGYCSFNREILHVLFLLGR